MSGIDNRVVSMTFDNESFERKLSATLASLDALTESLQFVGARQGFDEVSAAAQDIDFSRMEEGIDNISNKFSAMGAVAFAVIQEITGSVIDFATRISGLVFDPLAGGGKQRAENIEQAKFLFRGLGADIEANLESARLAVTGTAFGLDAAAKAAAQLGGSGLKAGDEMTAALRGIAGLAAMTNTSYEEMADIFISAAGNGKVMSNELGRISHRGINAAAALAKEWGVTEQQVREMASNGEIDFKKFAAGIDAAFGEHATKANETYSGSLANVRAALARMGASFFGPHMEQQRDLFNSLQPVIDNVHDALKPLITTFLNLKRLSVNGLIERLGSLDLSGLKLAVPNFSEAITNAFIGVNQVFNTVKEAFREIFPPQSVSLIERISEALVTFTEKLKMGGKTLDSLRSIFKGVFSIISIGIEVVKGILSLFGDLFSSFNDATGAGGGILGFFANVGESLADLKKALVDGGGIAKFFERLGEIIKDPIKFINELKSALAEIFTGGEIPGSGVVGGFFDRLGQRFEGLRDAARKVGDVWQSLSDRFAGVRNILSSVFDYIRDWFSELGQKLAAVMQPGDFNEVVDVVNIGLLGGIGLILRKFFKEGLSLDFGGGFMDRLSEMFDGLTGTLQAMQTNLKAEALLKIAGAVGILAISLLLLSTIDSASLTKALTAITISFAQLIGAMALMEKISLGAGAVKLSVLAGGMILLSIAVGILAISVKALSDLSWEELAKGLLGVTGLLVGLTASTQLIAANTSGMVRAGIAMIGISVALLILSKAVEAFADMSWEEMAQGLVGVSVGLGAITLAMRFMPAAQMMAAGLAMIPLAIGLRILAEAVEAFADMSWGEMAQGLVGVFGGLVAIGLAMNLMPPTMIFTAGALVLVGVALNAIALAVSQFGGLSMEELAKGIGALAATLLILAVGVNAMNGAMAGAAALVVVSGALLILTQVIKTLGSLSISEIAIGLGAIAAAFVILGVAGLVLAPLVPTLLSLGLALTLIGAGFALFGVGVSLVAKGFEVLAKSGREGIQAITGIIEEILKAIPRFIQAVASAIFGLANEILEALPVLIKGLTVVIGHLLDTVVELAPKFASAAVEIVKQLLRYLRETGPDMIETGLFLLTSLLEGIRDNIYNLATLAVEIITNFASAIAAQAPVLVDSAVNLLLSFLSAIANRADEIVQGGINVVVSLLQGIASGIGQIVEAATGIMTAFIQAISNHISSVVTAATDLIIAFVLGLTSNINRVVTAVADMIISFITTVGEKAGEIAQAGADALVSFLGGIADNITSVATVVGEVITAFITAVGDNATKIARAGGDALVDFLDGIMEYPWKITSKVRELILAFVDALGKNAVLLFRGAADVLIDFLNGLAQAIRDKSEELRQAGINIATAIMDGMSFGLTSKAGGILDKVKDTALGMVVNVKEVTKTKSPSRVFMKIGEDIMEGLAIGVGRDANVHRAVRSTAYAMIDGFQKALSDLPTALDGMNELHPTITPVLDLTRVQSESKKLDKMIGGSTITPEVSFDRATLISLDTLDQNGSDEPAPTPEPQEIKFEQNIYAPRELSVSDIYRSTKSQITMAKEELNIA